MVFRYLLRVLACGLALAACSPVAVPDDAVACAGIQCTAGQCVSSGGQPLCRCGEWEDAAGAPCAVGAFETRDEHGGSPASATVLTVPMPARQAALQEGRRPEVRDRDLFTFTAVPGHVYLFRCGEGTLRGCELRLLDASGHAAPSSSALRTEAGQPVRVLLALLETAGPWYVEVSSNASVGTYTYQLEDLGLDDHGGRLEVATPLQASPEPSAFPVTHSTADDRDVFSFLAVAGHGYRFRCAREDAIYQELRMTAADGTVMDVLPRYALAQAEVGASAAVTEQWFVELRASSGRFPMTSSCWLEDRGLDEHSDGMDGATPVTPGVPVSVTLQSRTDVDVLAFTGEAGHLYALRAVEPLEEECEARLADAQGRTLMSGMMGSLRFKPEERGTYYVILSRASTWMPTFSLMVVDEGADDHGDTPSRATDIGSATSISGRFESPLDTDAIAFAAEAGHVYLVECGLSCDMAMDFTGRTPVGFTQVGIGRYLVHAPWTERLVLLLRPQPGVIIYYLWLTQVATDDFGDSALNATPLTLPASVSGAIQTVVDEDVFSVQLVAGRRYVLTSSVGSLQRVVTTIGGVPVAYADGVFSAPWTDTYLVRIFRGSGMAQSPWSFTLREQ